MKLSSALRYLDQHTNLEATAGRAEGLSLERMARLVHVLGDPQDAYPVIHVTGTNGKGSVSRMATRLLQAQGLSVGTYSSPHLEQINERLSWDGVSPSTTTPWATPSPPSPPSSRSGRVSRRRTSRSSPPPPSAWFADLAVDVAVVEVGLLGRFDATNVARRPPWRCCTNVGRDHTDGAPGLAPREVAGEKAGIVKPGVDRGAGPGRRRRRRPAPQVFAATPAADHR